MFDFADLDRILDRAVFRVAPAVVCRVEVQGKLVYERAAGVIDATRQAHPLRANARFDLASLTKLFTVTACLNLCTSGRLTLDTPVAQVLPAFDGPRAVGATEDPVSKRPLPASVLWTQRAPRVDAGAVTIRHLLTHTSGLPAWRSVFNACGDVPPPGNQLSRADIRLRQQRGIHAICGYDFAFPPALSYTYSDIGLILLGAVIANVQGADALDGALARLVVSPLGLNVDFNPSPADGPDITPTEFCPWRGRRLHGEVHDENAAGLGGIAGHAGLFGSAQDLCRLASVYLAGGKGYLSPDIVRQSVECQIAADSPGDVLPNANLPCAAPDPDIRRGLGWALPVRDASCGPEWNRAGYGHTGFTGTSLWCDPELGLAVALLTNRVYYGRNPEPIHALRQVVHTAIIRTLRRE